MTLRNLLLALKDQLPLRRFVRNFCITRNAWGLFHINSHVAQGTGRPKVTYNTRTTAVQAAESMSAKQGRRFSTYKCVYCDGYHIGKSRDGTVL
jgi:hypothetical protein